MSQTIRKYWGPYRGRVKLNFNWPIINHDSVVLITAAEFSPTVPSDEHRFMGEAPITVQNIAPHGPPFDPNHGVTFAVNIDWPSPIRIATDITVLDPPVEIDP